MIMITVPRMTEYTSTRVWEGPGVHLTQTFDILTQHLRVASAQCITQELLPHCSLGAGGRLESGFIWSLPHNDTHNSKNLLTHTCIHTHHVVYSPVSYRESSMWLSLYGRVHFSAHNNMRICDERSISYFLHRSTRARRQEERSLRSPAAS